MDKVKEVTHRAAGKSEEETSKFTSGYQHPAQSQTKPGLERDLEPKPTKAHLPSEDQGYQLYRPSGKLAGKRALITGGDSGIGRAVAVLYAMEGAHIAISHLPEEAEDAKHTSDQVEKNGGECFLFPADLTTATACRDLVAKVVNSLGGLDILVNNVAYQLERDDIADITEEQWSRTFRTNIDSYFFTTQAALPHLQQGSTIINTASVDAFVGPATHLYYAATKGAVIAFTRALSYQQIKKGIRVNAVAPGPVWTPLIATSLSEKSQSSLKDWTPMSRIGQPSEIATSYVFLASQDSSFIAGQTLHPNGGMAVNG